VTVRAKVPPLDGKHSCTRRHWIILRDPNCTPEKKGPFPADGVNDFIREVIACRPSETKITVVSLTWDYDIWVEDGRERIVIHDSLAELTDEDWREISAMGDG
jgi:hypothetical protein